MTGFGFGRGIWGRGSGRHDPKSSSKESNRFARTDNIGGEFVLSLETGRATGGRRLAIAKILSSEGVDVGAMG